MAEGSSGISAALRRVLRSNPGARLIAKHGVQAVEPLPEFRGIPALEAPARIEVDAYIGPTEESNWVLPGRLVRCFHDTAVHHERFTPRDLSTCLQLVGAYPSAVEDDLNSEILTSILELGITTFVCLQHEYQHHGVSEAQWRSGEKLRPYIFDALQLLESAPAEYFPDSRKPDSLDFVHLPIVDCATVGDSKVFSLAKDLCRRLKAGENLYVHCWGGHGRTGTVLSLMLGLIYGMAPMEAMAWVQMFHDCRIAPCGVPSPQTAEQRKQVTRILVKLSKKRDAEAAQAAAQAIADEAARAKARHAAEAAARQSVAAATAAKQLSSDPFAHYRQQGHTVAGQGHGRVTPDTFGANGGAVPPVALMGGGLLREHGNEVTAPATERLPHSSNLTAGAAARGQYQSTSARGATPGDSQGQRSVGNFAQAWDTMPGHAARALSRAKSPDTARVDSAQGRNTPGSPPPARPGSSSASASGAGSRMGAASRSSIQTPPVPSHSGFPPTRPGSTAGFVSGSTPATSQHQQPIREDSIDAKPSGKLRRTGRSYEPVGRTRGEAVAAEASMSSVTSDLPPVSQHVEHAADDAGGRPQPPASRVHLPSTQTTSSTVAGTNKPPTLPLGGGGIATGSSPKSASGGHGTLPSTGSAGGSSLMWKQPEVESWVNRLSGRRKPKSSSTKSTSSAAKPSSDVLRLARRSRRKRDGDGDSTSGSTSGFSHVRSKVPSRRVGGKKKGRSTSKRRGKRSSSRASNTSEAAASGGGTPAQAAPMNGTGTSLLGALPSIPDGRPGSGVVAGAGMRGTSSHTGNTRNMLNTPHRPAGAMYGYSHHQAAMASAHDVSRAEEAESTGAASSNASDGGMPPKEDVQSGRRYGAMQNHRRLVSAHPVARKSGIVASRGTAGARTLKPPPVSMG